MKRSRAKKSKADKAKHGNRHRLTIAKVEEALRKTGGFIGTSAQLLGCSRSTLHRFMEKHPQLRDVAADVGEDILDIAETKLIQNIRAGKSTDIQFLLRTKGKHRGFTFQVEHAGPKGGPIPVENSYPEPDFDSMTDEQLKAYIAWQEAIAPKQADGTV